MAEKTMEECGYLWTVKELNILNYLLFSGFVWIQMEVCVAEGESSKYADIIEEYSLEVKNTNKNTNK